MLDSNLFSQEFVPKRYKFRDGRAKSDISLASLSTKRFGMEVRMTFGEKLKEVRRQAGMSQEKLAEKLGVSRQAITKWETNAGIPDIENIMAVSTLFHVSIDELLSNEKNITQSKDYLFESVTEYDIDFSKRFDMKLGGANALIMSGYEGEKVRVRLASNTLSTLQNDFKLKIDDIKNRIDLDIRRKNGITEADAKGALTIFVQLPNKYIGKIELSVNAENIEIRSLECEKIELDTKTKNMILDGVIGVVEINCNLDMNIICNSLNGSVEINQVSATSRIRLPEKAAFAAQAKGIKTSISYEKDGQKTTCFADEDSDNRIELNGMKSELVIYTSNL